MKNLLKLTLVVAIFISFVSCEDNVNPFGDLEEKYVLNCVIRGDSTFQTATLTKSYLVTNGDPYSSLDDTAIKGAIIRLWNDKNKVTILKDTTISHPENSEYKKPYTVFYTNNFQPRENSTVEIEAILPDGKKLRSTALVPAKLSIRESLSTGQIPPVEGDKIQVKWESSQKEPLFVVRLVIYYFKYEDGVKKRNLLTVPLYYTKYEGEDIPVNPKPQSELVYEVNMETINKAMELISKDDPNKGRYEILSCIAEVLSLNEELSFYYNGTIRGSDHYSVKLDETDFSNIENGYGLFGVFMRTYYVIRFKHSYIHSFGYVPGVSDVL